MKLRIDRMELVIRVTTGDKVEDVYGCDFDPDMFEGYGPEELFEMKRRLLKDYEVRPSFQYLCIHALEEDPAGPQGIRHTMDQIQDWFHRRYVPPFAKTCTICEKVKALHGSSHSCKEFTPED